MKSVVLTALALMIGSQAHATSVHYSNEQILAGVLSDPKLEEFKKSTMVRGDDKHISENAVLSGTKIARLGAKGEKPTWSVILEYNHPHEGSTTLDMRQTVAIRVAVAIESYVGQNKLDQNQIMYRQNNDYSVFIPGPRIVPVDGATQEDSEETDEE